MTSNTLLLKNKIERKLDRVALQLESANIPYIDKTIGQWRRRSIDTFVVSFPKCGRTWLRLLISRSIVKHFNLDLSSDDLRLIHIEHLSALDSNIPKIAFEHDDDAFFKSAKELSNSKNEYKHSKVIFLVRDPRDVIVSTFFHKKYRYNFLPNQKSRQAHASYQGEITQFLRESTGSLQTLLSYYNIWQKNRHIPQEYLLLSYENLSNNTNFWLRQVLSFLGLEVNEKIIDEAISYASFSNMRKMETKQLFKTDVMRPVDPNNINTYKTREGKSGGFAKHLDLESIEYINQQIAVNLLPIYQYNCSTLL